MKHCHFKKKLFTVSSLCVGLVCCFLACQEHDFFDVPASARWKAPYWNNQNRDRDAIAEARAWYGLNKEAAEQVRLSRETPPLVADMEPHWKQAYTRKTQAYTSIEAPLIAYNGLHLVAPDAEKQFKATRDKRYLISLTRLIMLKYHDGQGMIGFFMTLSPSAQYLRLTNFRPFYSTYAQRDKAFDGYVYYHDLQGNFVNGWKYENGRVTQAIRPQMPGDIATRATELQCVPEYEYRCEQTEGYVDDEGEIVVTGRCEDVYVGERCYEVDYGVDDPNNGDSGGGSSGGGQGGNTGGYDPDHSGGSQTGSGTLNAFNFSQEVMTPYFKELVRMELGVTNFPKFTFNVKDCTPTANAQYYKHEDRINVCPRLLQENYTLLDVQAIVFHELVHVLQAQENRYPEQDEKNKFITTSYTFQYDIDMVGEAWESFYLQMEVDRIPRTDQTEEQQAYWNQYKKIIVDPVIEKYQNGETYTSDYSYKGIECEIEAYEKELEVFGHNMSPDIRQQQQEQLDFNKKKKNKIDQKAISNN